MYTVSEPFIDPNFGDNSLEKYEKIEKIGDGTYGVVYKARDRERKDLVALKKMSTHIENQGIPSTVIREVSLLREVQHSNIVCLRDFIIEKNKIYLVFEYFPLFPIYFNRKRYLDKDLHQYLKSIAPQTLKIEKVKSFLYQILLGVAAFHSRRILHRDLKPSNILVEEKKEHLKISDFGLARTFTIPLRTYTSDVVSIWYRAPELLMGIGEYSTAIDMWSVGCIFAELVNNIPLFPGDSELDQIIRIFRVLGTPTEETWAGVTKLSEYKLDTKVFKPQNLGDLVGLDEDGLDLLKRMLKCDPDQRISAKAAIGHRFFDDVRTTLGTGSFF